MPPRPAPHPRCFQNDRAPSTPLTRTRILTWHNAMSKASKGRRMSSKLDPARRLRRSHCPGMTAKPSRSATSPAASLCSIFIRRRTRPAVPRRRSIFATKAAFTKAETEILGVSADPVPAQDKFKSQIQARYRARLGRDAPHARGLWRLAGEVDVRAEVHGCRARHFLIGPTSASPGSGRRSRSPVTPKRYWPQPKAL